MYNTLMTYTHFLRRTLLLALLVPSMAAAYTSPEDVLNSDENWQYFTPPPRSRDAEAIQEAQQASAAARREREQAALFMKSSSSSSSAASDDPVAAPVSSASGQQSSFTTEEQRILERVRTQQLNAEIDERVRVLVSQQGLHSGAPLSDTGPGTILAGFVLAGAGLWTIWKARRLEAKQ